MSDGRRYRIGWVGSFHDVWVVYDTSISEKLSPGDKGNWVKRFWKEQYSEATKFLRGLNEEHAQERSSIRVKKLRERNDNIK